MTEDEISDLAESAADLGDRLIEALADETGRDPDDFDIDPDDYEFPDPDS